MSITHLATVAGGFLLVTFVIASPLIDFRHLTDSSYPGDSRLIIWTLTWDAHALMSGTTLFNANMFHPAEEALGWAEHHIGVALFALPVYAVLGNPVLAYWVVWILAFPLNGLAMYALAWRVTGDRVAACGAGLVFAFCFFRMHHAHGHLQMLWTWALPLVPLALERWVDRPSLPRAVVVGTLVVVQALSGGYLAVLVTLLTMVTAAVLFWKRRPTSRHVWSGAMVFVAAVPLVAWFERPYLRLRSAEAAEAASNAADLAAYLMPPQNTWVGRWVAARTPLSPRWIFGEQTLYVGLVTLIVAMLGLCAWRHRRDRISTAVLLTGPSGCCYPSGRHPTGRHSAS